MTSLSVLQRILSRVTKDIIPYAAMIVHSTLDVMKMSEDATVTRLGFTLLTALARYCGSTFHGYAPIVLPKVFATLRSLTGYGVVCQHEQFIYIAAQGLLLEIFMAIGSTNFTPFLEETVNVTLLSPPEALYDALLFFAFINEYTASEIYTIYGAQIDVLLSIILPIISPALNGPSLLERASY